MDLKDEPSGELLNESYSESPLAVECIDSMCLTDSISDVSAVDGNVTLVLPKSSSSNADIILSSEVLDPNEEPDKSMDEKQLDVSNAAETPKALYTIHFSEKKPKSSESNVESTTKSSKYTSEAKVQKTLSTDAESLKHQSDLHAMETTTRLEDFMDVVTTYKCKFCRFCCPWRSGLMSHIRNCHINANKKNVETEVHNYALAPGGDDSHCKKGKKVLELEEHGYSQSPHLSQEKSENLPSQPKKEISSVVSTTPPIERHVFLCGQCSEGFEFLEDCKNHMIKDHDLKLESTAAPTKTVVARRRGRPKAHVLSGKLAGSYLKESSCEEGDTKSDLEPENDANGSQRRTSRPPKVLEEDYYLGNKKKRVRRENSAEKPFRCNEKGCGYRFSNESQLHYHSNCHSSYYEKNFTCPECGQSVENWRGLSVHLWKEHTVDIDLYTCEECGYKTYSLFKLDNHKKIHSEERQFVCQTCNKGFKQLSQLRNHVVIHTDRKNMTEKRWYSEQKCEVCNRTFSDSKCLKKHQQAVHSKLKPFVCTYCGHMSARKAMLQLHMRQHTGEKPFTCEHCEYRTGDHNSLRRHRMRHTGMKPYKCPHCPYACIQAISYKTHLKNKHPGLEGLYACSLCSFHSVSKENHLNHMSDHKRGAIPETNQSTSATELNQPAQMHLPENTLQQLEGILPGNITAAQLIYSCLNALSQENGAVDLPPGVIQTSANDGTQTITIQIPTAQEISPEEEEQFFLTVQQGDETVLLPASSEEDESNVDAEILQPITVMEEGSFNDSFVQTVVCAVTKPVTTTNAVKCDA